MKFYLPAMLILFVTTSASAEVAAPCTIKAPTTLELTACAAQNLALKDKELNDEYEKLMKSFVPGNEHDTTNYQAVKQNLVEAQRGWIIFRKHDCEAHHRHSETGTIRSLVQELCMVEHTELRIRQLRDWRRP